MLFFLYIVCNFPAINQYNNNSARTRTWPTLLRLRRRCNRPSTAARKARSGMLGRYSPHPNFTSSCSHSLPTRIQTLRVSSSVSVFFSLLLLFLCSFSCDAVTRYATNEPTKQDTHTVNSNQCKWGGKKERGGQQQRSQLTTTAITYV